MLAALCAGPGGAAPRLSTAEAAAKAQERFEGAVLDIDRDEAEDDEPAKEVYEIRLLTEDGVIIRVRLDADTGAFLEAAGDNLIPAIRKPAQSR